MRWTRIFSVAAAAAALAAPHPRAAALLTPPTAAGAVADRSALTPDAAAAVAKRIAAEVREQKIVGISAALVRADRIVHLEHAGWEDREGQIPATSATMYRWASISKPLTAIAAMQLWEAGALDLDADVRALVPEFPDKGDAITCRQLLCHQGGIVHYANGPVVRTPRPGHDGRFVDVVDALDTFKASPLVCAPGEKYSYTTHGYILLSAAVQRAACAQAAPQTDGCVGERPAGSEPAQEHAPAPTVTYADLVGAAIAEPLGMTTLRPDVQWEPIPSRAVGYRHRAGRTVRSTNTDVSWKLGGGGFISNVDDLGLLAVGLLNDRLVGRETRELMFTPQTTADGKATGYGLGFQVRRFEGRRLVGHSGSQEKTRTMLLMLPDERIAVALMCNTEGTNLTPLAHDLLRIMLGHEQE